MNSAAQNTPISGAKAINISSSHSPVQPQQSQVTSPNFESSSRRSSSHSNSIHATGRNNQSQKKQHKNTRKPGLSTDDMAESNALRNPNSRRGQTSITHLMSFALPPRPQDSRGSFGRGTRRAITYGIGSGHHSSDKARYINANYRFIVKPFGDYKVQAANADQHLDWNDVLQILASAVSQDAACPICLDHPVAPRMAKCGHIFCLPCLIRYMHSADDTNPQPEKKARWKKCPICWDTVYISDTKPVRWYQGQEGPAPQEGDDVVLRLMMRQPGSTLALPRDGAEVPLTADDVPWYFAAEVMDYARIMKGSEEYMMEQHNAEIEDLHRQEAEDELYFQEEPEWTKKAANSIREAMERLKGIGDPPATAKQPGKPKREPIEFLPSNEDIPEMYFIQHASKSGVSIGALPNPATPQDPPVQTVPELPKYTPTDPKPIPTHARPRPPRPGQDNGHHPNEPYFFYQSLLHYYLSPLDIRILKTAFGNFASFPSTLLPRVERVSTGHIMDDDLRKRAKYLSHLPHGCEVGFLECNWTDAVAPEVLEMFREEIEKRRKRNRDKETREERDRVRAERAEDAARWATARRRRSSIPSVENLSSDGFHALAPSSLDAHDSSPPWPVRNGASFASLALPSTSPNAPRTVWGTAMIAGGGEEETRSRGKQPQEDDGWLHSWEQELLEKEDELVARVQQASLAEGNASGTAVASSSKANGGEGGGGGKGKKKKAKKITLMSTTARRAA